MIVIETGPSAGGKENCIQLQTRANLPRFQLIGQCQQPAKQQPELPLLQLPHRAHMVRKRVVIVLRKNLKPLVPDANPLF